MGSLNTTTIDAFTGMSDFLRGGQVRTMVGGRLGVTAADDDSTILPFALVTTISTESAGPARTATGSKPPSWTLSRTGASSPTRRTVALTPCGAAPDGR